MSAEVLADRLWSTEPTADAANAGQRVVSDLRRILGHAGRDLLATKPAGNALLVSARVSLIYSFMRRLGAAHVR